jgi:GTP-binding protein
MGAMALLTPQVTSLDWKDHVVNVVDTPGHADFGSEVQRILQVRCLHALP